MKAIRAGFSWVWLARLAACCVFDHYWHSLERSVYVVSSSLSNSYSGLPNICVCACASGRRRARIFLRLCHGLRPRLAGGSWTPSWVCVSFLRMRTRVRTPRAIERVQRIVFTYIQHKQKLHHSSSLTEFRRKLWVRLYILLKLPQDVYISTGEFLLPLPAVPRAIPSPSPGFWPRAAPLCPGFWGRNLWCEGMRAQLPTSATKRMFCIYIVIIKKPFVEYSQCSLIP